MKPQMHPEHRVISQRAVERYVEHGTRRKILVAWDLGYAPLVVDERPTRVRADIVTLPEPEHNKFLGHFEPRTCLDCPATFAPRSWNHRRCAVCAPVYKAEAARVREKRRDVYGTRAQRKRHAA